MDDLDYIQLDSWQICTNCFLATSFISAQEMWACFLPKKKKKMNEYIKAYVQVLYVLSHW